MSAGLYNITVEQGSDYQLTLTCTQDDGGAPINFTGATIYAQIKQQDSAETSVGNFTVTNGGTSGVLTLTLPGSVSVNYVAGIHKYDVLVQYSTNVRQRLIEGYCTIDPDTSVPS